ncbi:MAG: hypothetical protein KC613_28030 [Myxococcales bacterium]|nr:hypothetical protein [Myxococcales bacterium]
MVGTAQAAAVTQVRRGVQLIAAVADCVAPHARRPPQWSPVHEAIVTGRVEGRFRLGLRVADLTMLLIGSDGREMTRCPLDGLPGGIAGQTLLRGIQGHFGLHGHTLTKAPAGTFQLAAVEAALAEGDRPVELARLALAG